MSQRKLPEVGSVVERFGRVWRLSLLLITTDVSGNRVNVFDVFFKISLYIFILNPPVLLRLIYHLVLHDIDAVVHVLEASLPRGRRPVYTVTYTLSVSHLTPLSPSSRPRLAQQSARTANRARSTSQQRAARTLCTRTASHPASTSPNTSTSPAA